MVGRIFGTLCVLQLLLICFAQSASAGPLPTPTATPSSQAVTTIDPKKTTSKISKTAPAKKIEEQSAVDPASQPPSGMRPGDGASLE